MSTGEGGDLVIYLYTVMKNAIIYTSTHFSLLCLTFHALNTLSVLRGLRCSLPIKPISINGHYVIGQLPGYLSVISFKHYDKMSLPGDPK